MAGVVVGAIGVDAVRHVRDPRQVPLASLPVVLAAHQLIEVLVWWGLDGTVTASIGRAAAYAYLLVAFALPLLVPGAVAAIEPDPGRRRLMQGLGIVGALVAMVLLASVVRGPVEFSDAGNHVLYQADLVYGGALAGVYVVATLGALLVSSHRFVVVFGVLNLVAVAVLFWLLQTGFISLWCAWAAVASLVIAVHLRRAAQQEVDVSRRRATV